jgi:hypothetical protein
MKKTKRRFAAVLSLFGFGGLAAAMPPQTGRSSGKNSPAQQQTGPTAGNSNWNTQIQDKDKKQQMENQANWNAAQGKSQKSTAEQSSSAATGLGQGKGQTNGEAAIKLQNSEAEQKYENAEAEDRSIQKQMETKGAKSQAEDKWRKTALNGKAIYRDNSLKNEKSAKTLPTPAPRQANPGRQSQPKISKRAHKP